MNAKREDWQNYPMPDKRLVIAFEKSISSEEMIEVRKGLVPLEMEDKWFCFCEENSVFFHRSWTGHCVYEIKFEKNDEGYRLFELVINNEEEQGVLDVHFEKKLVEFLIDRLLLNKKVKFPSLDDSLSNEQSSMITHSLIGYGSSRKDIERLSVDNSNSKSSKSIWSQIKDIFKRS